MKPSLKMDEREQQVTSKAAWYGFCASLLLFFALAFGYNLAGLVMPWSTQLIVLVACAITFVTTVRNNGYHFRLPGILPETDVTLGQPAAIRAIPWTMFAIWLASSVVDGIPSTVRSIQSGEVSLTSGVAFSLISLFLGFYLTRAVARDVRLGRGTIIRALNVISILSILGIGALVAFMHIIPASELPHDGLVSVLTAGAAAAPLTFLWSLWYEITLIRYRKVMEQDASWDPKQSFWTAEHWAAKHATPYILLISSVCYLVFNVLSLLQQYNVVVTSNPWVFIPSLISAAAGGVSLMLGIALSFWQYWKQPKPLLLSLLWAGVIIAVNVLIARYTPGANILTF
jgi:hypothetical protein